MTERDKPGKPIKQPKRSSGTLLYRRAAGHEVANASDESATGRDGAGGDGTGGDGAWEVLLVHPSGNYNRHKPWSIPKGVPDEGEELEAAARRETQEEADVVAGALTFLGEIAYRKSGKRIFCYAGPAPDDARPRCASWEVDRAEFLPIGKARTVLHPDQAPFLDLLLAHLASAD
ncbi:MAG: NUDIX domain-containing protein [Planctomycetales bacterium]|nr:NUDIX domain-containing protein [Planctomycetales bacterium]